MEGTGSKNDFWLDGENSLCSRMGWSENYSFSLFICNLAQQESYWFEIPFFRRFEDENGDLFGLTGGGNGEVLAFLMKQGK